MSEYKPKPCPFCGDECYVDDGATHRVVCINKDNCCYQGAIAKNKADAIAAHNRVCRAVETAAKHAVTDCNHLGNAAKMREALSDACYAMFNFLKMQNDGYEEMAKALDKAKAALADLPRNCDIGTAFEQVYRHSRRCAIVDHCEMNCRVCFARWSQMPYDKGEAK